VTADGSTPGVDPTDETRTDWPPAGADVSASPPVAPSAAPLPPAAPQPAPPGSPWAPYGSAGPAWGPPPTAGAAYGVPGAPAVAFAGTLPRVVAYIMDGILLAILGAILYGFIASVVPGVANLLITRALFAAGLDAIYFVGFWTSGGQATLGMRLLRLQVGNAFDGQRLVLPQAVRRWIALGSWLTAFGYTTTAAGFSASVLLIWSVVLLATTISSPTRQGLHDRFANSAVVQPFGGTNNGIVFACLIVIGLLALLALLSIVALIFLGDQVSPILSTVGASVVAP
jgi:hypothetical protein